MLQVYSCMPASIVMFPVHTLMPVITPIVRELVPVNVTIKLQVILGMNIWYNYQITSECGIWVPGAIIK